MPPNYSFSVVIERLMQVLQVPSERALAHELGLKPAAYYNRKRLESLPMAEIVSVCLDRSVSIDWVFTGVGEPLKSGEQLALAPVAAVEPNLLGLIIFELDRAFQERGLLQEQAEDVMPERAGLLGILASGIYNKVAFLKGEKARRSIIRAEAEWAADIAKGAKHPPAIGD